MTADTNKVAAITLAFWIMKICATTLGETAGDLLSMTLNVGYAVSTLILLGIFLATLIAQLSTRNFHPALFWLVILSTSTAGTTLSDFMDRSLGLGYATGASVLVTILVVVLVAWYVVQGSLSVDRIQTRRAEVFYWMAILVSNTLGTALGDFLADSSGLGFLGGAAVISAALLALAIAYYATRINRVVLFWLAFVLTRPFGATFGDLLTKPTTSGGLGFGTIGSSAVLAALLVTLIIVSYRKNGTS
jgi:uncharacterized membrane-anchored protein